MDFKKIFSDFTNEYNNSIDESHIGERIIWEDFTPYESRTMTKEIHSDWGTYILEHKLLFRVVLYVCFVAIIIFLLLCKHLILLICHKVKSWVIRMSDDSEKEVDTVPRDEIERKKSGLNSQDEFKVEREIVPGEKKEENLLDEFKMERQEKYTEDKERK